MDEESSRVARHEAEKKESKKKFMIAAAAIVLLGCCIALFTSMTQQGNDVEKNPVVSSEKSEKNEQNKQNKQNKQDDPAMVDPHSNGQTDAEKQDNAQQKTEKENDKKKNTQNTGKSQKEEPTTSAVPMVSKENRWMTRLVNSKTLLDKDYAPELVTINSAGYKFDARAADRLNAMMQAARDEGLSPMVCSSYRSWDRQNILFEKQVVKQQNTGLSYEEAYEKAKTVVAFPGTSEHQTGLAADIVASSHQVLDDSQENTAEQKWLMEHCWEYGFILRYPKDKSDVTGIIYEPWHYRYVGNDVAEYIHKNNLCLEEYWQKVEEQNAEQKTKKSK